MEIGQAPSKPWTSRELQDRQPSSSSSSSSSSSVAVAKQTSILLVDLVWTILIFGLFLGAAYLIKRSRDVCTCYTVSTSASTSRSRTTSRGQHVNAIGCRRNSKPRDHLTLEINDNLVEVDRGGASAAGHVLDFQSSPAPSPKSCSSSSASSVGSNLSSFWGSRHGPVDIFGLSSKSAKVTSNSSMVGQSRLQLAPTASNSLTLHEFEVRPSCCSCKSYDEQAGFGLKGRSSKRILRASKPFGGRVDNDLEELALSFPPGGTYKHGGSAGAGAPQGSRRFRADGEGEAEAVQMYYHEIHSHEDLEVLESNTRSEINTLYDAPTTTDYDSRVDRGGLLLGAFRDLEKDAYDRSCYERSVEGDRSTEQQQPGGTPSRVLPQGQRSFTVSTARANAAASEEPSCRSTQSETAKNFEGPRGIHVHNDDNIDISRVTQLQSNLLDYGQFHFSDPDLNDWWRPRA